MSIPTFLKGQIFVTPPEPTTNFNGQTIIVTGANTGLGLDCAKYLVKLDATRVILACRSIEKGEIAKRKIKDLFPNQNTSVEVWHLDLGSYKSILQFTDRCSSLDRLDAVMENAGVSSQTFSKAEVDETTITVNVVAATLFTILLLPKLRESATKYGITPHVSVVSSVVHAFANIKELSKAPEGKIFQTISTEKLADMSNRYNLSKLLVLFSMRELSNRVEESVRNGQPRIIINNPAPGWAKTELFREEYADWPLPQKLIFKAIGRQSDVASRCLVHGISAGAESQGQWLSECKVHAASSYVRSKEGSEMQSRIWNELMTKLEQISPGIERLVGAS